MDFHTITFISSIYGPTLSSCFILYVISYILQDNMFLVNSSPDYSFCPLVALLIPKLRSFFAEFLNLYYFLVLVYSTLSSVSIFSTVYLWLLFLVTPLLLFLFFLVFIILGLSHNLISHSISFYFHILIRIRFTLSYLLLSRKPGL